MPDIRLTMNQVTTVAAIRNYIHLHGHPPTLRELAALLDRSRGTTTQRIRSLVRKGIISRPPRTHRTLDLIPPKPPKKLQPLPPEDDDFIVR